MRKKIIIILGIIILLAGAAYFYLKNKASSDITPLVKSKLTDLINNASNGLYKLTTDSIHLDVLKGEITLYNARLNVDSSILLKLDAAKQAPDDIFTFSLKKLDVTGIDVNDLMNKKEIDLSNIYLDNPVVEIFHQKRSYNYTSPDTADLYSRIQNGVGHFSLKDLLVRNVDLAYHNLADKKAVTKFNNVSFHFTNILIDSATQKDTTRFLYAEKAFIILKDYNIHTKDSLYNFHLDSLALNAAANSMTVSGISFQPGGNKNDFSKKISYYKDRYSIRIDAALVQGVDWYDIISGENFDARQIDLINGNIEVFADRTLPNKIESKIGNYPQQLLGQIHIPVSLSKLTAANFEVAYRELNPKSNKVGNVLFEKVYAVFTNLTNNADSISKNKLLVFTANSYFMGAGKLHSVFTFDLSKLKEGNFSIDAKLGEIDGTKLNPALEALGLVKINSANIHDFELHMHADNYHSSGTVKLIYDSLKVTVLQPDSAKMDTKKRALISFIANNFILRKQNSAADKNTDLKNVALQRDPHKSFFSLIWKTIQQGITKTIKGNNN